MDPVRRSNRPRMVKKKTDIVYFDDQKIELNDQERDLIYPNEKPREKRYCFCKRTEEEALGLTMIECDSCHDWFHDECLGRKPEELESLDVYYCPACSAKPIKYMKKTQPSNADIELLLTALAELDEEKPKNKKKESRIIVPKVSLFHFAEAQCSSKNNSVIGFIKNESSSSLEENKMITGITKLDIERGTVWTPWGMYHVALTSDNKIQASSENFYRSPTRIMDEKCESPVSTAGVKVENRGNKCVMHGNEIEDIEIEMVNHRFQYKPELGKRILEANKCGSFEKLREHFNASYKLRPAGFSKVTNNL